MLAEFVQVSAEELDVVRRDPEAVGRLFHRSPAAFGALTPELARAKLERLAPLLSGALQGLDPRLQEQLAGSLGRTREALANDDTAALLLDMMRGRGLVRDRDGGPGAPAIGAGPRLSLDKAWHGLHYLLYGQAELVGGQVAGAVLGGHEIGEDEGYGPARYFTPGEVAELAGQLDREETARQVAERYQGSRMSELGIYPGGWDEAGRGWLMGAFRDLRSYFHGAAENGRAIITSLV